MVHSLHIEKQGSQGTGMLGMAAKEGSKLTLWSLSLGDSDNASSKNKKPRRSWLVWEDVEFQQADLYYLLPYFLIISDVLVYSLFL